MEKLIKFIYSEKATKFCEIFPLLLTTVHTVKSKGKISKNFVAFSEYMNFSILERFLLESELLWRAYGIHSFGRRVNNKTVSINHVWFGAASNYLISS